MSSTRNLKRLPSELRWSVLGAPELRRGYFPGTGLLVSILLHGLGIVLLLYAPVVPSKGEAFLPLQRRVVERTPDSEPRAVMWLPRVGGAGRRGAEGAERPARPQPPVSARREGPVYPGTQRIVSDPLHPTNRIQTLLQPELRELPVLQPPPLPNLLSTRDPVRRPDTRRPASVVPPRVETTAARAVPPLPQSEPPRLAPRTLAGPSVRPPRPERPSPPRRAEVFAAPSPERTLQSAIDPLPPRLTPRVEVRDILSSPVVLTPVEPPPMRPAVESAARRPRSASGESPPPESGLEETHETSRAEAADLESQASTREASAASVPSPSDGSDREKELEAVSSQVAPRTDLPNMLALSPLPATPERRIEIPYGEARGRFAVGPRPHLESFETGPGAGSGSPEGDSTSAASGDVPAGEGGTEMRQQGGIVSIRFGSQSGSSGVETAGAGAGIGISGSGAGAGSGAGPASSSQPFAGITVLGGVDGSGARLEGSRPVTVAPAPVHGSYSLFVVSTEEAGGGLPSLGVFTGEQVYTLFLDMREHERDPAPRWTLQFSAPRGPVVLNAPGEDLQEERSGFVFPYPAAKTRPDLPPDLVRPHVGRMVIVYGVINLEGDMEDLAVKESPDPRLNGPVLTALDQWVFRPAFLEGRPVAAKVLLGIPLWLPR